TTSAGVVPHVTLQYTELDHKPSSCPYLFTWNGERFEFITDFMGGGEMGYQHAPGVIGQPDPEEFTRIDGSRLAPRNGRYELRVTNELEETLFLDQAQLIAVDHPASVQVHPREGAVSPPFPGFQLYAAAHQAGLPLDPPALQVKDAAGRWQTAIAEIGIPVGRPQTIVVDLSAVHFTGAREVRLVTSMRVYWDRAQVATWDRSAAPRLTT